MKTTGNLWWYKPREYHWQQARAELKVFKSTAMWLRIVAIVLVISWVAERWLKHVIPDLEADWFVLTCEAIAAGILMIILSATVCFIPPMITVGRTSLMTQQGQSTRSYPYKELSNLRLITGGKWPLLRFTHRHKEIEIPISHKISLERLVRFLEEQELNIQKAQQ